MSQQETDQQIGTDPTADGRKVTGLRRARPCPICDKPSVKGSYPFCSQRCKDVDLSRWLSDSYAIPAEEEDNPDDEDLGA